MSFTQLFRGDFISELANEVVIVEPEAQSKIKNVKFKFEGRILNISPNKLNLNGYFKPINFPCDKSIFSKCDGAFLIDNEGSLIFFLCEIKSTLGLNTFLQAKTQIESTFLKSKMFLLPVENYNLRTDQIKCLIIGHISDEHRNHIQKAYSIGTKDLYYRFVVTKKTTISLPELDYSVLPIKEEFLLRNVTLYFVSATNEEEQNIEINIDEFLS